MKSLFEELKTGLQEAIDYETGNGSAKTTKQTVFPEEIFELEHRVEDIATGKSVLKPHDLIDVDEHGED